MEIILRVRQVRFQEDSRLKVALKMAAQVFLAKREILMKCQEMN